jgi:Raf kinase inhibitor-like YbhB/YbcL family protein
MDRRKSTALVALAVAPCFTMAAQQGDLSIDSVTSNVYEPQKLPATDERVQSLQVAAGFRIHRFAEGLDNPRIIAVADNGTVYATQRMPGNLVMLRDIDADGIADVHRIVVRIPNLHGIALRNRKVYLVDIKNLYVGDLLPDGAIGNVTKIIDDLPDAGQHSNRTLAFGPDGMLYLSIGSDCNACFEPNPEHATLLRVDPDTGQREIYASHLRNTIGFGWHPGSGRLYGLDHGIDALGDNTPLEELNEIVQNGSYGWPYLYENNRFTSHPLPPNVTQEELALTNRAPVDGYTAHSAPMQLLFAAGNSLSGAFQNDAIATMRGSWNRSPPSGYELVRVRFDGAGNFEGFEPFVTGFLRENGTFGYFGRPVGLAWYKDGSLLAGDDTNNIIYRVLSDQGNPPRTFRQALASKLVGWVAPHSIELRSSAITQSGAIPEKYSDYGAGISPPLSWTGVPSGAKSVVILMEDPQAASPIPFVHWTVANLPPEVTQLPEAFSGRGRPTEQSGARQGVNSKSELGYFGPRPPASDPPHPYHFQIFALDTALDLPEGFNRQYLLKAMWGHVLAQGELVGTFDKIVPEAAAASQRNSNRGAGQDRR